MGKCASFVIGLPTCPRRECRRFSVHARLWRADLGSEEIAYRTAQSLYSLYRLVRVTDPPKWVRQTISTVMPRAMSALPPIADICCTQADVRFVP